MTFWCILTSSLLILTAAASLKIDVDELLSLNHADMTHASPLQVTSEQFLPIKELEAGANGVTSIVQLQPKASAFFRTSTWWRRATEQVPRNEKQETFVLKKVTLFNTNRRFINMEKLALESVNHPFIIRLHASLEDKNSFYFLMEQGCSPDLAGLLQHRALFNKQNVQFYVASIMLALEHMHFRGIIHRDLKLENIVLGKDGFPRIIDFGSAKPTSDNSINIAGTFGTPEYLSPETMMRHSQGTGVDWWALGHIMHEMLSGEDVFPQGSDVTTATIKFSRRFNKDAADLIKRLMEKDQSKRLGVVDDTWKIITEHPWFAGFDWIKLLNREVKAPVNVEFLSNGVCEAVIPTSRRGTQVLPRN